MDAQQILQELETLGTEQNQKTYRRHGVRGPLYGVSYASLDKLQKRIKVDHSLAVALWQSGNHDARILAARVADPQCMDDSLLENWSQELDNYVITDAFSDLASRSPLAMEKMQQWIDSDDEWIGSVGWNIFTQLVMHDSTLPDSFFEPYLEKIEQQIHQRKNRMRYAMNNSLIAIGLRSEFLREKALAAAEKIGRVTVDHGETNCKTPDASPYILKAWQRKSAKKAA